MNKKLMSGVVVVSFILAFFVSTAWAEKGKGEYKAKMKEHHQAQKAENKTFRESIKDLTAEEKQAAVIKHREEQFEENVEFHEQMHQKKMDKLKAKLDSNPNLTEEERTKRLQEYVNKYQERVEHKKEQHQENIDKYKQIQSDQNLTPEQKKEMMKTHRETQKEENKALREETKEEFKAKRKAYKEKYLAK